MINKGNGNPNSPDQAEAAQRDKPVLTSSDILDKQKKCNQSNNKSIRPKLVVFFQNLCVLPGSVHCPCFPDIVFVMLQAMSLLCNQDPKGAKTIVFQKNIANTFSTETKTYSGFHACLFRANLFSEQHSQNKDRPTIKKSFALYNKYNALRT